MRNVPEGSHVPSFVSDRFFGAFTSHFSTAGCWPHSELFPATMPARRLSLSPVPSSMEYVLEWFPWRCAGARPCARLSCLRSTRFSSSTSRTRTSRLSRSRWLDAVYRGLCGCDSSGDSDTGFPSAQGDRALLSELTRTCTSPQCCCCEAEMRFKYSHGSCGLGASRPSLGAW